jgi:peptidoglycan/LPS O-acetylase OafA/YrhL
MPSELQEYGKSVVAATFSLSNVYFYRYTGYFSAPSLTILLLHTWSLGIEEQFYLLFPVFVLAAHRLHRGRLLWPLLASASLLSLAWSVRETMTDGSAAFYLLPSRAWELLLGSLIVSGSFVQPKSATFRNLASATGLGLIGLAIFGFSASTPFPGLAALCPCVGSALIILAGQTGDTVVGRMLSWSPLVFLGRISYSLYLWHWPIFVYTRISERFPVDNRPGIIGLVAVLATLVVATLSWKYIERPFRAGPLRPSRPRLFKIAGSTAVLLTAVGLITVEARGFPARYSAPSLALASYLRSYSTDYMRPGTCFLTPGQSLADFQRDECLHRDNQRKNYLILGDSHAAHLWYGLSSSFAGNNFLQANAAGCHPLSDGDGDSLCRQLLSYIFSDYLQHHDIDGLILAAAWDESNLPKLTRTLDWAAGRNIRVILVGPMVQYDDALPRLLAVAIEMHNPSHVDFHRRDLRHLDEEMRKLAEPRGFRYISLYQLLCEGGSCVEYAAPGLPLQFDYGHLTKDGSLLVAQRLRERGLLP